jgi:hypothetical protein|tara:strand:- start:1593 stop:2579 length:987 start_codon:yes stop_codon:yes gene_type:complete
MKKLFTILVVLCTTLIYGQDSLSVEKSKLSLEGSADIYYRSNLNTSNTDVAPSTSFANLNGFSLGMFNLKSSYESGKTGFVADLVFGPRGEDAVFLSTGNSSIVNQLYAYWNVNDKLTLTMGNFNTFLGYEVISPIGNFNYSTSYMFSYGPFSHSGLKADFAFSEDFTGMLAVLNATDETEYNSTNLNTLGAQLGYKNTYLNAIYGKQGNNSEATFQVDLTAGYDLSEKFYLGVNTTYNETDGSGFYGAALYPQYNFGKLTTGVRAEYFSEFVGSNNVDVIGITTTLDYVIDNLNLKLEYRLDKSSQIAFEQKDNLSSIVLAAVYSFN